MTDPHDECGCQEYRELSRRGFVTAGLNVMALALPSGMPGWLPEVRWAQSANSSRDVIVSIFMRGGADGLSLVAPFGDAAYYSGRPTIAIPRPDAASQQRGIALDNFFMLPQGMAGLRPAYLANQLLIVHATGQSATNSRSHFEAEHTSRPGSRPTTDRHRVAGAAPAHLGAAEADGATARSVRVGGDAPHAHRGPQDAPHSAAGELPTLRA
ncbi:MAG: hypothetical protein IPN47_23735 [Gemmatimonadetes bacterium]|nr:hypothetical protein [Gemmatimonadota bacterium]